MPRQRPTLLLVLVRKRFSANVVILAVTPALLVVRITPIHIAAIRTMVIGLAPVGLFVRLSAPSTGGMDIRMDTIGVIAGSPWQHLKFRMAVCPKVDRRFLIPAPMMRDTFG